MLHEKSGFCVLYINYIAHADNFSFSASGTISHKTKIRNRAVKYFVPHLYCIAHCTTFLLSVFY